METGRIEMSGCLTLRAGVVCGFTFLLLCLCSAVVRAQNPKQPQRGFYPAGSYALSDIETINATNGNLILRLPLVSLPAGRGSMGAGVGLYYNSKVWETYSYEDERYGEGSYTTELKASDSGGWRYGFKYDVQLVSRYDENRPANIDCTHVNDSDYYIYKLRMKFPDGSEHIFRPSGYTDALGDNFFRMRPDGWQHFPCQADQLVVSTGMTYYSADGTFMRLTFAPDSDTDPSNNPWTLSLPDGTRVTGGGTGPQRVYDRNNNYVEIRNITYNNNPATEIIDQLGRHIVVEYGPAVGPYPESERDYIHAWRTQGGQLTELVWTVKWRAVNTNKQYYGNPNDVNIGSTLNAGGVAGVSEIDMPAQAGGLSYSFGYNVDGPSGGWGEVSSMTLPSGARANYKYFYDITSAPESVIMSSDVLKDYPYQKDLQYQLEYDSASTQTTETWQYSVDETSCVIIAPDGGVTREHFNSTSAATWDSGLSYETENPDGSVVERYWKQNIPYGYGSSTPAKANSYVKTEFTSVTNAAGALVKTAIKDYAFDKNGNLTQEADYDWVAYGDVQRDVSGKPTGAIPASAQVKRMAVNGYFNQTPDASSTASDANTYTQPTAPSLRKALSSAEVRSGFADTSALSRTELYYDNASTTGNLTEQRGWDSTKGALVRPLSTGTYVSATHQYDAYGNPTLSTDARGVQTQLIYNAVNGFTDLYPTKTVTALNTSVQRTSLLEYDFNSGLVTRTTDADNNVSTSTAYDVFGRPTLVVAAEGKPEETRTLTVYSDVSRRVVVRRDLNTAGDGRLVSIQHYDQLGRVRLTRTLEDSSAQSETDETTGIKVQTRYAYGTPPADPYSYTLVSNPYRAANSATAASELTMGWSRTKVDQGGRVVEAQTFKAGTASDLLPAPWGTNSASTGAVTTAYDAEYTTVTDQMSRARRSATDALGRLARVDEPDKSSGSLGDASNPVQPNAYSYDALGNLTLVRQGGSLQSGVYTGGQTRSFAYSSLSRLTSATSPETCQQQQSQCAPVPTTYNYDQAGNLVCKTDARGVSAHYEYDALNRVTRSWYNGSSSLTETTNNMPALPTGVGATDEIRYFYDSQTLPDGAPPLFDRGYAVGRLVATVYGGVSSGTYIGYDALGKPLRSVQQTGGVNYPVGPITYNLSGAVTSEVYPSGNSVSYRYDAAGRLGDSAGQPAFSGTLGDRVQRTYSSEVLYHSTGAMSQERFGTDTALYHKHLYNSRGQLAEIRVGFNPLTDPDPNRATSWQRGAIINDYSATAWGVSGGGADNNGNLRKQEVYIPTVDGAGYDQNWSGFSQTFSYDYLNRLSSATESSASSWTQSYTYDSYGNRTVNAAGTSNALAPQFTVDAATNRLTAPAGYTMSYDAAGNLTYDNYSGAGTRTYDAENRMTAAQINSSQSAVYTYDGEGHRVKRNTGSGEVWQVYGVGGELLAEYAAGAAPTAPQEEYGYRSGELLVTATVNAAGWGPPPGFAGPDPLSSGDQIKLEHLTDLRNAVNQLRQRTGLAAYDFNVDRDPQRNVTTVKADHIRQLRAALEEARTRLGLPTGGYFQPALSEGSSLIYAKDFQELRDQIRGAWAAGSGLADVRWLVADQVGTPRMVIDKSGALSGVRRHDYFPFGEEILPGRNQQEWRAAAAGYGAGDGGRPTITSKERDSETGLDYFGARYYGSVMGRFLSCDPITGTKDDVANPQRWNLYSYVINNPVNLLDTDGRKDTGKGGGRVIDIFITFPAGARAREGQNWSSLKEIGRQHGNRVNIYGVNDGSATVERAVRSLRTPGRTVLIVGHSTATPEGIAKADEGGRAKGQGLYFSHGSLGGDSVYSDRGVSKLGNVNATNVLMFTCDSGSTVSNMTSSMNGKLIVNDGGKDGESAVDTQEDAAFAAAKVLASNGTMENARDAAQNVFDNDQEPVYKGRKINQGDKILLINAHRQHKH